MSTSAGVIASSTGTHIGNVLDEHAEGYRVIDCTSCGFAHLDPIPQDNQLLGMYEDAYYDSINAGWYEKELGEQDYWQVEYDDRLRAFSRLGHSNGRRLLDIGCSFGFFLAFARRRGWDVLGIEPSASAARLAEEQGVPVRRGFFQQLIGGNGQTSTGPDATQPLGPSQFDAVHLKLVLEHVTDPEAICRQTLDILRPGGVACFQVPNDYNRLQDALRTTLGKRPYWVAPPFHVNYFSFESLEGLLRRSGFEIAAREATFPMELFVLMGDDYIGNDEVGRAAHARRMRLERNLESSGLGDLRRSLYDFFARLGLGRECVVYGRKPLDTNG